MKIWFPGKNDLWYYFFRHLNNDTDHNLLENPMLLLLSFFLLHMKNRSQNQLLIWRIQFDKLYNCLRRILLYRLQMKLRQNIIFNC